MLWKRSKKSYTKVQKDQGSMLLLWISISACLAVGLMFSGQQSDQNNPVLIAGIIVFVIGNFLRWISIIQLGSMFTVDVAISKEHQLKTNGIYGVVRHPSYLGLFLILIGLSLGMNSVFSFLIVVLPNFLSLNYRIKVEEKALLIEFSEEYKRYMKSTKKIIPLIY